MAFSESDTRSTFIDPFIKESEWLESNIAIIEAKAESKGPLDGMQQSINYTQRLHIDYVYTTNGIILHTDKDNTVIKYSVLNDNKNLFVSKYQLYFPTEEELRAEIEKDVFEFEMMRDEE